MQTEIKNQNSQKKYLIIGTFIALILIVTSYFGSNQSFKGDLNYVTNNLNFADLTIESIYLDPVTNKLQIVQANIGTADNNIINSISTVNDLNSTSNINATSDINLYDGATYVYIFNNSDVSIYRKIIYKWIELNNKNFLKAQSKSILESIKLDSNKYTIRVCIDPTNIIKNEKDEPGAFDCDNKSESNNFMEVNLDKSNAPLIINMMYIQSIELKGGNDRKLFKFVATPDANMKIALSKFSFNIESSEGVLLKNISLYKSDSDGNLNKEKDFILSGDTNTDSYFSNGENIIFNYGEKFLEINNDTIFLIKSDIEMKTLKTKVKPSLKISMLGDVQNIDMSSYEEINQANYNFIWNDSENGWNNGFAISGLPTDGQMFIK